jgi:predicted dienelactone hydrolase
MSSFGRLFTPALAERLSVRTPAGTTPTTPSTDTSTQGPDPVGVRDVVTAQSRLRVRVYYPADRGTLDSSANPAKFFKDPLAAVLKGHLHTMSSLRAGTTAFNVAAVALQAATSVLPLAYATLPSAWHDIQPLKARDSGFPVLLFSHGLTGTGEEHATLFCHLARTGYVVACIHHCDGSSSR